MKRWLTKPLGELLKVQNGFAFKSELFNEDGKGLPIIRIRDLARGYSETFYDGEHESAFEVENGDFLIGMDGEFRCYRWKGNKALLNQRVCRLQNFSSDLNAGYVFYGINDHLRQIEDNTSFVTVKHLSSKQIASIKMPMPPLAEQERIVKLLDEGGELRKLRAQADNRFADLIPALFHEMFGDINFNDKNWPSVRFAEIGEARLGKMLDAKQQTGKHKRPYLRNANVQWDRFQLDDLLEMDFHEADREEFRLQYGDLLICEGGEVGRAAIWRGELDECYFQKALHRVRMHPSKATPEFALHLLRAIATTNSFRDYVGSATIPHLTGVKLASIRIPLPPLPLQQEFAQRVSEIRELQAAQAASRQRTEHLFQSMLHRAFNQAL